MLLPSQKVGFSIGDVAGHDRHAAALMGQFRSATRALAGQVDSPAELIAALRFSWDLLDADRITTALFAQLDVDSGELVMASAGHYPPLLVARGMTYFLPVPPTTPLGAPASRVRQWSGTLKPGEVLLLYTDGAIDERSSGSEASMERLAKVASAWPIGSRCRSAPGSSNSWTKTGSMTWPYWRFRSTIDSSELAPISNPHCRDRGAQVAAMPTIGWLR